MVYSKAEVEKATLEYFNGDELATSVWVGKYALKNKEGEYLELTPEDMHWRLAREFGRMESKFAENALSEQEIFDLLKDFKYVVPQGSPMFGIGNDHVAISLSNCVVIESPDDTMSSIVEKAREIANLSKRRCGIGIDISTLRPEGTPVNNAANTTTGAWSFADLYSYIGRIIGQFGRRAALMITMDVRHPDIFQFITMKQDKKKVTGANVSVKITDEFMESVKNNDNFMLRWPVDSETPKYTRNIKAKKLWDLLVHSATTTAEPGLLMWDNITNNLPAHYYDEFKTISTNPCLTYDVKVAVADGRGFVEIGKLAEEEVDVPVYCLDDKGRITIRTMRHPRLTGKQKDVYKVTMDDGTNFNCTDTHKIRMFDGNYKKIKDIEIGESIHVDWKIEASIKDVFPKDNSYSQNYLWFRRFGRKLPKAEHRLIYEFFNGQIPPKYVIHHIDFNAQNNSIDNLKCMSKKDHDDLHAKNMIGKNNPIFKVLADPEKSAAYRKKQSINNKGQKNKNSKNISNKDIYKNSLELTKKLNRRVSKKEWKEFAKKNNLPQNFTQWRKKELGNITDMLKLASKELNMEYINCDPKIVRTLYKAQKQGYNAKIENNKVLVEKLCEATKQLFWVPYNRREVCFIGVKEALMVRNSSKEWQKLRIEKCKISYKKIMSEKKIKQAQIYNDVKFKLEREPKCREWEAACRYAGVSFRLGTKFGFKSFEEVKEFAAEVNHKIISITYIGKEDVYNGTVDEFHNFCFGGFESLQKNGKKKWGIYNNLQCGEIPLSKEDSCRLISINLKHLVKNPFTSNAEFDFDKLAEVSSKAMRLSDDIVELEIEKLYKVIEACDTQDEKELWSKLLNSGQLGRRTGLGTHGLYDAIARLNLKYDSKEALDIINNIYYTLKINAYAESVRMAKERGAFPVFNWDKEKECDFIKRLPDDLKEEIEKYGRRNISILTNAPTGSVSCVSQTSSGIEPVFRNSYRRRRKLSHNETNIKPDFIDDLGDKWVEYNVFHHNIRDYMEITGKDDVPEFFITSDQINWEKRVELQAVIQEHIDHSISSCLLSGDNIVFTSDGLQYVESLANHAEYKKFAKIKNNLYSININNKLAQITEAYNNGLSQVLRIQTENGYFVSCTDNHKICILDEKCQFIWKEAKDIVIGDILVGRIGLNLWGNKRCITTTLGEFKYNKYTNSKDVIIPKRLTTSLARMLGYLCSDGGCSVNGIFLSQTKNEIMGDFINRVKNLFGLECSISKDKRSENLYSVVCNSRELSNYFKYLGITDHDNIRVPKIIMSAGKNCVKEFIVGATLDGYVYKNGMAVATSVSKKYLEEIQQLLLNIGIDSWLGESSKEGIRLFPNGNTYKTKKSWTLKIIGTEVNKFIDYIGFAEERKNKLLKKQYRRTSRKLLKTSVPVSDFKHRFRNEILKNIKSNMLYDKFNSMCGHLEQNKISRNTLLAMNDLGFNIGDNRLIDDTYIFRKVVSIDTDYGQTYDLSVPKGNSYVNNGFVTHNTINLPANTPVSTVKQIYTDGWEKGLKGITVYVDKSRSGVLITDDEKGGMDSVTYCIKAENGDKFYLIISYANKDIKKPYQIFVMNYKQSEKDSFVKIGNALIKMLSDKNISQEKIDKYAKRSKNSLEKLTRFISLSMKTGHLKECVDILNNHAFSGTLAANLYKILSQSLDIEQEDSCPDCEDGELRRESGCVYCLSCGWSRCQ